MVFNGDSWLILTECVHRDIHVGLRHVLGGDSRDR
jgi:hypothetical protein